MPSSIFGERESTVGIRGWQSSALVSPIKTLNRDAVPIGDDIEPVGESRVDVETGYEEEESLESEIPTVETNLKNPMSRAEQEREGGGHAFLTGIGVLFVSKVVVLGNIFKWNRWRKKEENEQGCHWYLLITFSRH